MICRLPQVGADGGLRQLHSQEGGAWRSSRSRFELNDFGLEGFDVC